MDILRSKHVDRNKTNASFSAFLSIGVFELPGGSAGL